VSEKSKMLFIFEILFVILLFDFFFAYFAVSAVNIFVEN